MKAPSSSCPVRVDFLLLPSLFRYPAPSLEGKNSHSAGSFRAKPPNATLNQLRDEDPTFPA